MQEVIHKNYPISEVFELAVSLLQVAAIRSFLACLCDNARGSKLAHADFVLRLMVPLATRVYHL